MKEEQKAQIEELRRLFLEDQISATEFERRKAQILQPVEKKPDTVFESKVDISQLEIKKAEASSEDTFASVGKLILASMILFVAIVIISKIFTSNRSNEVPSVAKEPVLSIEEEKRLEEERKELARIDAELAAKEKAKEKAEERAFLKTKAGRIWAKHRDWSKEDCELLAKGRVWIGMSIEMLKWKRGLPDSANPSNYGNGTSWQWCWHEWTPSCFYDNDNDGLIDSYN